MWIFWGGKYLNRMYDAPILRILMLGEGGDVMLFFTKNEREIVPKVFDDVHV